MKKFFIVVIVLAVLSIAGYTIAYLFSPLNSTQLEEYEHEVSLKCENAYIVREENIYYATKSGTVYNTAVEGERVSTNAVISNIFPTGTDTSILQKINSIDKKIRRLTAESIGSDVYSSDSSSMENEISRKMNETIELSEKNNVEKIHENKEDINSMREGASISVNEKIEALNQEKASIENTLNGAKTEITSQTAGIFSSYVDGLESVLTPERIQDYDIKYIRDIALTDDNTTDGIQAAVGDPICKVMNNHEWYVMGIADAANNKQCVLNKSVQIRFPDISADTVNGTITYTSMPDENGEYIFLVKVTTYFESAFSYRNLDAEIIFEKYSGYKIPTDAIHTGNEINTYYVNGMKGSETYKCDCNVLYTDITEGISIIESTESAKNKLSSMERLVVGER